MSTHDQIKMLADLWHVLLTFVLLIAWCVRLEAKVLFLEKQLESEAARIDHAHQEFQDQQSEKTQALWTKIDAMSAMMSAMLQAVGRLEGKLDGNQSRKS